MPKKIYGLINETELLNDINNGNGRQLKREYGRYYNITITKLSMPNIFYLQIYINTN